MAAKIPEELIHKITLMSYQLSPHPLAKIIKINRAFIKEIDNKIQDKYELYQKIADMPNQEEFFQSFLYRDLYQSINDLVYENNDNKRLMKLYMKELGFPSWQTSPYNYVDFMIRLMTQQYGWDLSLFDEFA